MNHANPSNADDNRSSEMEDVHAGWSQALKLLLRKFSMHESGPARGGIPFTVGGQTYTIHAKVSDIISDGDGHRQGLEWVGAGGMRCCFLHANVFGKRSGMDDHENVLITCSDPARFVLQDHDTLHEYADMMVVAQARRAEGRLTLERLEELRAATGLTCTAHGLLADTELRGHVRMLDTVVFDWLHTLFQEGAMSIEMYEMYNACSATAPDEGTFRKAFSDYLRTWQWPNHHASKGRYLFRLFDDYRWEKMTRKGAIVGLASEQYALYPVLRHYVNIVVGVGGALAASKNSFLAGCKMVDLWKMSKLKQLEVAILQEMMKPAVADFLQKHIAVYGVRCVHSQTLPEIDTDKLPDGWTATC